MKSVEFDKLVQSLLGECLVTLQDARQDYATDEDVFNNFKIVASLIESDKYSVLFIYFMKHFIAIKNYTKGKDSKREDIKGRFMDCINYLLLCYGMVEEDKDNIKTPEPTWDTQL